MGKRQMVHALLDPQPSSEQVVVVHRYYTSHKLEKGCE